MMLIEKYGISVLAFVPEPMRRRVLHMDVGDGRRIANATIAGALIHSPAFVREAVRAALSAARREAVFARLEDLDRATAAKPAAAEDDDESDPDDKLIARLQAMIDKSTRTDTADVVAGPARAALVDALTTAERRGILVVPEELTDPDALPIWPDIGHAETARPRLVHDRDAAAPNRLHLFEDAPAMLFERWLAVSERTRLGHSAFDEVLDVLADDYSRTLARLASDEVTDVVLNDVAAALRARILAEYGLLADMVTATILSYLHEEPTRFLHERLQAALGAARWTMSPTALGEALSAIDDGGATRWGRPINPETIAVDLPDYALGLLWFHKLMNDKGFLAAETHAAMLPRSLFAWGLDMVNQCVAPALAERMLADRRTAELADLDAILRLGERLIVGARNGMPSERMVNLVLAIFPGLAPSGDESEAVP